MEPEFLPSFDFAQSFRFAGWFGQSLFVALAGGSLVLLGLAWVSNPERRQACQRLLGTLALLSLAYGAMVYAFGMRLMLVMVGLSGGANPSRQAANLADATSALILFALLAMAVFAVTLLLQLREVAASRRAGKDSG